MQKDKSTKNSGASYQYKKQNSMKRVKYKTEKYNNSQSTKNVKRCKEVNRCEAVKNTKSTKIKTLRRQLLVQPAKKTKQSKNAKCQKRQKV